jgi:hypothetical protein
MLTPESVWKNHRGTTRFETREPAFASYTHDKSFPLTPWQQTSWAARSCSVRPRPAFQRCCGFIWAECGCSMFAYGSRRVARSASGTMGTFLNSAL